MTVSNAVANATFSEIVFYLLSGEWVTGGIDNDDVGFGVHISFDSKALLSFTE